MLEYCKTILCKVRFEPSLFEKELKKSMFFVNPKDREEFMNWCETKFGIMKSQLLEMYNQAISNGNGDQRLILS